MRRYKLIQTEAVRGLHFTPCGTRLLACVGTNRHWVTGALLIDLATGDERSRIEQKAVCYAVPPDASRFVLGGANQDTNESGGIVWSNLPDLASWERQRWLKRSLPPQYAGVYGLAFDPTGTRLAVAHLRTRGMRCTRRASRLHLTVTDPDTGEEEYSLPVSRVTGVFTSSTDGARLAATGGTGHDPGVTVFDLAARIPVSALGLPGATTLALRFLPDGRLAVANGASVFVLRADGGQQFALHDHTTGERARGHAGRQAVAERVSRRHRPHVGRAHGRRADRVQLEDRAGHGARVRAGRPHVRRGRHRRQLSALGRRRLSA
jgi:hypothetical protein